MQESAANPRGCFCSYTELVIFVMQVTIDRMIKLIALMIIGVGLLFLLTGCCIGNLCF